VWLGEKVEGSCRDTAASSRSSLAQGELKGKLELLVCVRCCRQRPIHSRAVWQARHAPTFRTPAGSAPARGCVKTPKSRISFPLEARIARPQCTLAPLPGQSAQALRDRSPPARLFTQSGELLCRPLDLIRLRRDGPSPRRRPSLLLPTPSPSYPAPCVSARVGIEDTILVRSRRPRSDTCTSGPKGR